MPPQTILIIYRAGKSGKTSKITGFRGFLISLG